MPAPSDAPLTRQDLMLYTEDRELMQRAYGRGWTAIVRALLRQYVKDKRLKERYGKDTRRTHGLGPIGDDEG